MIKPLARSLGIKKEAKLDRFGEQGYAIVYWGSMGIWGTVRIVRIYTPYVAESLVVHHEETSHLVVSHRIFLDR